MLITNENPNICDTGGKKVKYIPDSETVCRCCARKTKKVSTANIWLIDVEMIKRLIDLQDQENSSVSYNKHILSVKPWPANHDNSRF